jgi:hypothetical protein
MTSWAVAIDLCAGTIGGCSGIIAGGPFDTIKVRLQAAAPGVFQGPVDCFLKTVRREGVRPAVAPCVSLRHRVVDSENC